MRKRHSLLVARGWRSCLARPLWPLIRSLVRSSPAAGSVLKQAPREIRLSFNESIEAAFFQYRPD